jgi:hypothetical protein
MEYATDIQEFLVVFAPIALIAVGVGFGALLLLGILSSLFSLFADNE